MNLQPTLENELLKLRPLQPEDFDGLYAVASDPLLWAQHPATDRYQRDVFLKLFDESLDSGGALVAIDSAHDRIIGSSRYALPKRAPDSIEIGWSFLARSHWGGKYNGAMKQLMLAYAFQHVDYVLFYIGHENVRSQKAVEKIGGQRLVGAEFDHLTKDPEVNWTYRISKFEWTDQTD